MKTPWFAPRRPGPWGRSEPSRRWLLSTVTAMTAMHSSRTPSRGAGRSKNRRAGMRAGRPDGGAQPACSCGIQYRCRSRPAQAFGGEYTTGEIAPVIDCPNASCVVTVNVFDPLTSGTMMLYAPVESDVVAVLAPPD